MEINTRELYYRSIWKNGFHLTSFPCAKDWDERTDWRQLNVFCSLLGDLVPLGRFGASWAICASWTISQPTYEPPAGLVFKTSPLGGSFLFNPGPTSGIIWDQWYNPGPSSGIIWDQWYNPGPSSGSLFHNRLTSLPQASFSSKKLVDVKFWLMLSFGWC